MIRDPLLARKISDVMLDCSKRLAQSVAEVAVAAPAEESSQYRRAVGNILGAMLLDIMNPLYRMHPDIKPVELEQRIAGANE